MRSYWIRVGTKTNEYVLIRDNDTETHRAEDRKKTEAEIPGMRLQVKECEGPPGATRNYGKRQGKNLP